MTTQYAPRCSRVCLAGVAPAIPPELATLTEAVAGKIEAAERERDRLASEMQTAKYAISVCEGEVDELAEG